jgi:hypothetical protein
MTEQHLEEMELIAMDTKKEFTYNKHTGEWFWADKGSELLVGSFKTRLEALQDAVEPYFDNE